MRKLSIVESVTLDGVMQAPGQPDEVAGRLRARRLAAPYNDETMGREMAKGMGSTSLLLGRWTYEQFYGFWPKQTDSNPFTDVLDNAPKYVASTTLDEPLPWQNSTLLDGDARESVAALKAEPGDDLVVLGSGELVHALMQRGLIDEFVLISTLSCSGRVGACSMTTSRRPSCDSRAPSRRRPASSSLPTSRAEARTRRGYAEQDRIAGSSPRLTFQRVCFASRTKLGWIVLAGPSCFVSSKKRSRGARTSRPTNEIDR